MARLMGKKQISQLNYFDYIVGITIGSIAAEVSSNPHTQLIPGLISMILWGLFPILLSYITLKNLFLRRKLEGTSTIFIQNGVIVEKNLRKERYHLNDLLEELRMKGIFNISEVAFAILETNGQISILLKSDNLPLTKKDMNISKTPEALSVNLIFDGEILYKHLSSLGLSEEWLMGELKKQHITSPSEILLAVLDQNKNVNLFLKNSISSLNIID